MLDFAGKVVLVTGGAGGIGQGIVARFAEAGAAVAIHYRSSDAAASALAEQIVSAGGQAATFAADLTVAEAAVQLIEAVVARFGRLDVLVNNAAQQSLAGLLDMSAADWDAMIAATLRSVFLCTQAAAHQMIARGGGAIINITSIEAEHPAPLHSHYNAAKAGVLMHTRAAAAELGAHGIRVNAVAPGLIWRDGLEAAWPEGVARWQAAAPLQRLGTPADVADACLFLASPGARWITGASLCVDGGVTTGPSF
ncbi:short-chain dehydrogenase [Kouleothrix aurantiaca]|uniref:Short-chain dehydrogenase n=1 Tax=Kouleothrix aurantiaca TaxID=186479 RepID=A0A0N8PR90_9CHLR|nr:short-chain dehydrogenase [Kouleothrix aurantiaca]